MRLAPATILLALMIAPTLALGDECPHLARLKACDPQIDELRDALCEAHEGFVSGIEYLRKDNRAKAIEAFRKARQDYGLAGTFRVPYRRITLRSTRTAPTSLPYWEPSRSYYPDLWAIIAVCSDAQGICRDADTLSSMVEALESDAAQWKSRVSSKNWDANCNWPAITVRQELSCDRPGPKQEIEAFCNSLPPDRQAACIESLCTAVRAE